MSATPDAPPAIPVPPQRRRRKEARPSELSAAALSLFVEKGFAATRLEDVAARAGVSKGTLYLYFDGKEALFKAVIEQGIVPVLNEGESLLAEYRGNASGLLRCLLQGWWQAIGATELAGVPKLMISEANNFPDLAQYYHDRVISRGRALLAEALRRGIASGEFRPVDIPTMVNVLISPLLMLAIWRYSFAPCAQPAQEPQAFLDAHFDLIINGLQIGQKLP